MESVDVLKRNMHTSTHKTSRYNKEKMQQVRYALIWGFFVVVVVVVLNIITLMLMLK